MACVTYGGNGSKTRVLVARGTSLQLVMEVPEQVRRGSLTNQPHAAPTDAKRRRRQTSGTVNANAEGAVDACHIVQRQHELTGRATLQPAAALAAPARGLPQAAQPLAARSGNR